MAPQTKISFSTANYLRLVRAKQILAQEKGRSVTFNEVLEYLLAVSGLPAEIEGDKASV